MYRNDTIAAISTPPGKGGVALIRISGPEASDIASRCFFPKNGKNIAVLPRVAVYGDILCRDGITDSGIAIFFKAPASFTGEDTVELTCHGGALITRRVLESVISAGARLAEPGEFSRRALINGKLSLCGAEALSDLLSASTNAQLKVAVGNAKGKLDKALGNIYSSLADALASLYAKIDFPDEDLADMDTSQLLAVAKRAEAEISSLIKGYENTACVREGVPAAICGLPNTGKSSLYNAFAGEELAIVTNEAGTTRDVLSSQLSVGNVLLRLSDTAGVREAKAEAEAIGVNRALSTMKNAALVFLVFDGSKALTKEDMALARRAASIQGKVLPIVNKADLPVIADITEVETLLGKVYPVSAKTGAGIEELKKTVEQLFLKGEVDLQNDVILSSARQYSSAVKAKAHLTSAIKALSEGFPPDCAATDIESAVGAIGEMDGRAVDEEVVGRIFSNFCVGK